MSADIEFADPFASRREPGRHAFEWGLSSLFLGSVLTVMFPIALLVLGAGTILAMNWTYWDAENLRTADTIARIVGYVGIGVGVLAVLFALFGLLRGLAGRQPLGACVGGLLMSLIGLLMMVLLTIII